MCFVRVLNAFQIDSGDKEHIERILRREMERREKVREEKESVMELNDRSRAASFLHMIVGYCFRIFHWPFHYCCRVINVPFMLDGP